jgi:hypothetical protein
MTQELNTATTTQNEINGKMNDLSFSIREPTMEIESAQRELKSLRDPKEIFCSRLDERDRDVVKAYRWITENRDRFVGECYGPVGMEIQVSLFHVYFIYRS